MLKCVVLNSKDNVATAMTDICIGEKLELFHPNGSIDIVTIEETIPLGHKFACGNISADGDIIKYGEVIGKASKYIKIGQHVHVHNLISKRGRGDIA